MWRNYIVRTTNNINSLLTTHDYHPVYAKSPQKAVDDVKSFLPEEEKVTNVYVEIRKEEGGWE